MDEISVPKKPPKEPMEIPKVQEFQPRILWNGRFAALDVQPKDARDVIAAADSGGLFRTRDGGSSWHHVDTLRPMRMFDVKRSPRPCGLVVAAAAGDGRTVNEGGIWVSFDGGETWRKPPTSNPPSSTVCNPQANAYGISFAPDTDDVYVGTDCGLAISRDGGATWSHVTPDPTAPALPVFAVAAQAGGIVNTYGQAGFRRSLDGGLSFGPAAPAIPIASVLAVQGLAVSPAEPNVMFLSTFDPGTASSQIFETDDAGATWTSITGSAGFGGRATRPPFVSVSLSADGDPTHVDVYFGNGVFLFRQTCPGVTEGVRCGADFTFVPITHADPSEVGFDSATHCAVYLATDGGIHLSDNCGASWPAPQVQPPGQGLDALQIYEIASQVHPDHTDLYFGTQDNSFWASGDGGLTWPNSAGSEGFLFSLLHMTPTHVGQEVTFSDFVSGVLKSSAHLEAVQGWNHPPVSITGIPAIVAQGVFFEFARPSDGPDQLWITMDSGATWTPVPGSIIPAGRFGRMFISGPPDAPVIYQPLGPESGGATLVKITGARTATAVVERADCGLSSIGQHCTMFCAPVFAVDPNDPDHLIAADEIDQAMKVSRDGRSWEVDARLTSLVTGGGEFLFSTGSFGTQASAVAFHTTERGKIFVGTDGNGILRSVDEGRTWRRVIGGDRVPEVTSFAFDENTGADLVSSFGRGLWRIEEPAGPMCGANR